MRRVIFVAILCCAGAFTHTYAHADDFDLYILAGQSNMDGYGLVAELPPELAGTFPRVMIFHADPTFKHTPGGGHSGLATWRHLKPGHGTGFRSQHPRPEPGATPGAPAYSDRFGPELAFASRLLERNPDRRNIAIIKLSIGGTPLDARAKGRAGTWDPRDPASITNDLIAAIGAAHAIGDIDGDGEPDTLHPAGIVWMQGESDGVRLDTAQAYEANLLAFLDIARAAMRAPDLPVAIGRISDSARDRGARVWAHGDLVRDAQQRVAAADPFIAIITETDEYGYSDRAHYDTEGCIRLGRAFADAIDTLASRRADESVKQAR